MGGKSQILLQRRETNWADLKQCDRRVVGTTSFGDLEWLIEKQQRTYKGRGGRLEWFGQFNVKSGRGNCILLH